MDHFFDKLESPKYDKKYAKIIRIVSNTINELESVTKLMVQNPYDKIVPFNMWFKHELYQIEDVFENGQHIRTRRYKNMLLTPLLAKKNKEFSQLKSCLRSMSLYQPFYPETFYGMWEFLSLSHLKPTAENILHIGAEDRLGSIEAIMIYLEKNQRTYQYNTYHCWIAGDEEYDLANGSYKMAALPIDYLGQSYKLKYIDNTKQLAMYDFISIDVNSAFLSPLEWGNEERDLHANIFYVIMSMEHLKNGGAMMIKLNNMLPDNWRLLFDLLDKNFEERSLFRASVCNPFNPELYLYVKGYNPPVPDTPYHNILRALHRQETYLHFRLGLITTTSKTYAKYKVLSDKWILSLEDNANNLGKIVATGLGLKVKIENPSQWHVDNNLPMIDNLLNGQYIAGENPPFKHFSSQKLALETSAKKFTLRPTMPFMLYEIPFYQKIIEKRAELNFCKRIMDSRPSRNFSDTFWRKTVDNFITWEQLTNSIDPHKHIKNITKTECAPEMATGAWIKMYEMLSNNVNIIDGKKKIKTFHICEAPGAFISATNHYIDTYNSMNPTKKVTWDWYAQTLVEQEEGSGKFALGDRYGLIKHHPDRWIFGDDRDDSGDITHSHIIKHYAKHAKLHDIDFMTSDAGLRCHPRELNEQEAYMAKISMGQIICILACLSTGKSAIFKTFLPLTEPLDISMIYLLTHLFESVEMIKPMTSHSYNSEIYLVLKGYKGIKPATLNILYDMLDDTNITSKSLLFISIDKTFFKSYLTNIVSFVDQQMRALLQIYYYYFANEHVPYVNHDKYVAEWRKMNPIMPLNNRLLPEKKSK